VPLSLFGCTRRASQTWGWVYCGCMFSLPSKKLPAVQETHLEHVASAVSTPYARQQSIKPPPSWTNGICSSLCTFSGVSTSHVPTTYVLVCSADILADLGLKWVILGHSERRALLKESSEVRCRVATFKNCLNCSATYIAQFANGVKADVLPNISELFPNGRSATLLEKDIRMHTFLEL